MDDGLLWKTGAQHPEDGGSFVDGVCGAVTDKLAWLALPDKPCFAISANRNLDGRQKEPID
jgi:hypothetical protein